MSLVIDASITMAWCFEDEAIPASEDGYSFAGFRAREIVRGSVDMSFNGALRTVFDFIEKPYQLWCTGNEEDEKTTLKLVFAKRARHDLNDDFRTAAYSLPFLIMQQSVDNKSGVVEPSGIEPLTS